MFMARLTCRRFVLGIGMSMVGMLPMALGEDFWDTMGNFGGEVIGAFVNLYRVSPVG